VTHHYFTDKIEDSNGKGHDLLMLTIDVDWQGDERPAASGGVYGKLLCKWRWAEWDDDYSVMIPRVA
jgi:hypothetical protein